MRRVDVGVAGVVEDPEQVVEPDVDARRLDQAVVEGVDTQPSGGDFGADVAIGEQHPTSVAVGVLAFVVTPAAGRCSSMAEHQLPKLNTRVRFPSSAPHTSRSETVVSRSIEFWEAVCVRGVTVSRLAGCLLRSLSWSRDPRGLVGRQPVRPRPPRGHLPSGDIRVVRDGTSITWPRPISTNRQLE